MKTACPHCSQNIEIDAETLAALQGSFHFACPACTGAVPIPTSAAAVLAHAHRGLNRNLLILGAATLLVLGGLAFFIASRKSGDTHVTQQTIRNEIINNTYFQQLIAAGTTTEKDLAAIATVHPYGDGFIGVSKEQLDWNQSLELARKTGSSILPLDSASGGLDLQLSFWLRKTFTSLLDAPAWVTHGNIPHQLKEEEIQPASGSSGPSRVLLLWTPVSSGPLTHHSEPGKSVVYDPAGNLTGDDTRSYLDIVEARVEAVGDKIALSIKTAFPFPQAAAMKGRRLDIIWFVDVDRNTLTGQSARGNDYNIHLWLAHEGWQCSWYKVTPATEADGIHIRPQDFVIDVKDNTARLTFPRSYLPYGSFDWWAYCGTLNAPDWPPLTENHPTMRATFVSKTASPSPEKDFTFTSDGSSITVTGYNGPGGNVVIPAEINSLPVKIIEGGFGGNESLTGITIPAGVTRIGPHAFDYCGNLERASIPDSITTIGPAAFGSCRKLNGVILSEKIISIGWHAFEGCWSLSSITIPASVALIENGAFGGCRSLPEIGISEGNPAYRSIDGVLFDKSGRTLVQYPGGRKGAYRISDGVLETRGDAFINCGNLTGVTIPDSVVTLGGFFGCSGLTEITIPDSVTALGDAAFEGCSSLFKVNIGSGITSFGPFTFQGSALKAINIPANIQEIHDCAFRNCKELTDVFFLGDSPSLGKDVFANTAPGLTLHYRKGAKGFTTPEWNGYRTREIASPEPPTAPAFLDWISSDGRTLKAKFIKLDGQSVVVEKEDGAQVPIPFARLSPASVELAETLGTSGPATTD